LDFPLEPAQRGFQTLAFIKHNECQKNSPPFFRKVPDFIPDSRI